MQTHTYTTTSHYAAVDGTDYPTTFPAYDYLPHRLTVLDDGKHELIYAALGDDYEGYDRVIDTHIKNLRQKIEPDAKQPRYLITMHGVGYRFSGGNL